MTKLRVGVIDLVSRGPERGLFPRIMNANMASIMPQVVSVWCTREGHDVSYVCYTGFENLVEELPDDVDLVFITAFTEAALTAYALSNRFQSRGAVTVLGGPHARSYPHDASRYFDYVLGFTDRSLVRDVLQDCSPNRPFGVRLSADKQPDSLPSVRERWPFVQQTLKKAPIIKIVPMIGSLGCPYTCSFCIDAKVPYQPLDFAVMRDDLRFLRRKMRRPAIAWHDPNFAVRFNAYLEAIEEAVPPGSIEFIAESSLSILSEDHLKRLKRVGCRAMLPGIESWFDLGNKSKTGAKQGLEKVKSVSEHVNLILRYIPYVQTNFVLGLDGDSGPLPFELTKKFLDMTPGAFPGYSLLTAFGGSAPVNEEYRSANRVLPFPFHLLNNNLAMNVRPKNYAWGEFYSYVVDLLRHSFSLRMILRRFRAGGGIIPRWMNVVRAISTEGRGRLRYYSKIRDFLKTDPLFTAFFEQESNRLPDFYTNLIKNDLGSLWEWLPTNALEHDPGLEADNDGELSLAGLVAPA